MTELTEDSRIERMLAEGKLTAEEAERLRGSLAAHAEREAPLRAADAPPERRRLWLLIINLMVFFLLGAATVWWLGGDAADVAATAGTESTTSAVPEGRLIDLSALSEERSTTMKLSLPVSFAIDAAQGEVEAALTRLFAIVESYPDLKASRNFLALQDQIEGTENRVAMERRFYNELSRQYNTKLQTFPGNIVADMMGFKAKPYFEAEKKALKGLEDPFGRHGES